MLVDSHTRQPLVVHKNTVVDTGADLQCDTPWQIHISEHIGIISDNTWQLGEHL